MSESGTKVVLVTGASSGIGQAVAVECVRRDWQTIGASRRNGGTHPGAGAYTHLQLDLSRLEEVVERVENELSIVISAPHLARVCLVNNAADPSLLGTLDQIDPAAALRSYAVNVVAPIWLMGWVVRRSRPEVPVRIVNVSSGAGVAPFPGLGTYGGTKAALRLAGMVFASELADGHRDVTILSYSPGRVDTPMQKLARSSSRETLPIAHLFSQWHAEGALLKPEVPAAEIVDYAEGDGHPRFVEWRCGERRDAE